MPDANNSLDRAGRQAAYIANEWSNDPAIMQTQALCYVGIQLERIADALEAEHASQHSGENDADQ
ncbi:hypothetical protein [Natronorubrum sulfidifaciens]|uniref:Uncharacterized protein n=1 Tax=Natronorubrum sulfidifaciens JCM 14089 TaxID=1230460 RepID=L9WGF9_9EURY|nr:hypothetical protein [Natronorubrum sulfidifaciens]ELY48366.1 hypothetical protein C495_02800 [Natronorubrum sulfidifaciens JCM 14089]